MSKRKDGYLAAAGRALEWLLAAVVVAAALAAVVVPRVAGATPYAVLTGSMNPGMPPGSLVVVRPTPIEEIEVGEVITYQPRPEDPSVVTHRVVGHGMDANGELVLWTQGDASEGRDAAPVHDYQIVGRAWYMVPYLGHVTGYLDGPTRRNVIVGAALLLFGYAAAMFLGALRDRVRRVEHRHA